jgi:hypothetical protein
MRKPSAGRYTGSLSWALVGRWSAVAVLTVVAIMLSAFLLGNGDERGVSGAGGLPRAFPAPASSSAAGAPDRGDDPEAVAERLKEIFALQDRAFRNRDEKLLGAVFADDCPCLRAARERIRKLRADRLRWVGYRSRVTVARVERSPSGTWSVTAAVSGSRTRVETDEHELLRIIPAAKSNWTFVLSQPAGGGPMLLQAAEASP